MVVLSEKHTVKFFEKSLSSAFFAVCPYSCSRILVQSMVHVIKKKIFFLFASFADKLFGIPYNYETVIDILLQFGSHYIILQVLV